MAAPNERDTKTTDQDADEDSTRASAPKSNWMP
jgi:hypothetical protein